MGEPVGEAGCGVLPSRELAGPVRGVVVEADEERGRVGKPGGDAAGESLGAVGSGVGGTEDWSDVSYTIDITRSNLSKTA